MCKDLYEIRKKIMTAKIGEKKTGDAGMIEELSPIFQVEDVPKSKKKDSGNRRKGSIKVEWNTSVIVDSSKWWMPALVVAVVLLIIIMLILLLLPKRGGNAKRMDTINIGLKDPNLVADVSGKSLMKINDSGHEFNSNKTKVASTTSTTATVMAKHLETPGTTVKTVLLSGSTPTTLKRRTTNKLPPSVFRIGVGRADMTGPSVGIHFFGFDSLHQIGTGIHTRVYARAFIFEADYAATNRVVLVVAEIRAIGYSLRKKVVSNLQERYGQLYTLGNVIIAATGTHSAPGGHMVEFYQDLGNLGFSNESYNAYAKGITESIIRSHETMMSARIFYTETKVLKAQVNRSPSAYENNPSEERARYRADKDRMLTQLRIEKMDGSPLGIINWFSLHANNMGSSNTLVSSDNLGLAAVSMEMALNDVELSGKGDIVAAFAPGSLGDVSPNIYGGSCRLTQAACDFDKYKCGRGDHCVGQGPTDSPQKNTKLIATRIYKAAMTAFSHNVTQELTAGLYIAHQFFDMVTEVVPKYNPNTRKFNATRPVSGCAPAVGTNAIHGTIDGVGTLNLTDGGIIMNALYDTVADVVATPTLDDRECHTPKQILISTGRIKIPFEWHPTVVSASILNLGGLIIACVPGEPTTMAGRRIKDIVGNIMRDRKMLPRIVISGLINEYIHYVTTFEEYQKQSYEGALTIFGPHTLDVLLNKYGELTRAALDHFPVDFGPLPPDNVNKTLSMILPAIADGTPLGWKFGGVWIQPPNKVQKGTTLEVKFIGANPRNNLKLDQTYLLVEKLDGDDWVVIAEDGDWETQFIWTQCFTMYGTSYAVVSWSVPTDAITGLYRIRYFGAVTVDTNLTDFEGVTNTFEVVE